MPLCMEMMGVEETRNRSATMSDVQHQGDALPLHWVGLRARSFYGDVVA